MRSTTPVPHVVRFAAAISALLLGVAACGAPEEAERGAREAEDEQAPKGNALRIGLVTFLSGNAAEPFGIPARDAAERIVAALNKGEAPEPYGEVGIGRGREPSMTERSEWQSPAAAIRTSASPGPGESSSSSPTVSGRLSSYGAGRPISSSTEALVCKSPLLLSREGLELRRPGN